MGGEISSATLNATYPASSFASSFVLPTLPRPPSVSASRVLKNAGNVPLSLLDQLATQGKLAAVSFTSFATPQREDPTRLHYLPSSPHRHQPVLSRGHRLRGPGSNLTPGSRAPSLTRSATQSRTSSTAPRSLSPGPPPRASSPNPNGDPTPPYLL